MAWAPTRLLSSFLAVSEVHGDFLIQDLTCSSIALPFLTPLEELSHYCRPIDLYSRLLPDMPLFHRQCGCLLHAMMRCAWSPTQLLQLNSTFPQAYMAKISSCLLSADVYYVLVQFFTSINLLWWFKTNIHLEKSENVMCSGPIHLHTM